MHGCEFRIVVVGTNEIEREGLTKVLRDRDLDVIANFQSHLELLSEALPLDATLLVMLNALGDDCSREAVKAIRSVSPTCRIVVLERNCDSPTVALSFAAGTDAYVAKATSCASLVTMLELVALGEKVLPPQIIADLPLGKTGAEADAAAGIGESNLSDREIAIMRGLIGGEPNKVISRRLFITEATVKVHVKSILRKIGAKNRTQAAIWGVASGLKALSCDASGPGDCVNDTRPLRNGHALAGVAA